MCKYQSWFRVNQRWISAVQRWKSNVSEQRKSALNSADSELFLSETALFSSETALNFSVLNSADSEKIRADVYHVLWISAEKRQNYETALFSADYLWDFNPGELVYHYKFSEILFSQHGTYLTHFGRTWLLRSLSIGLETSSFSLELYMVANCQWRGNIICTYRSTKLDKWLFLK